MSIKLPAKIKKHIATVGYYAQHGAAEAAKVEDFVKANIEDTRVQSMVANTMVAVRNGSIDAETAINDIQNCDLVQFPAPVAKPEKAAKEAAK